VGSLADCSFRLAAYSFNFAVFPFFDTEHRVRVSTLDHAEPLDVYGQRQLVMVVAPGQRAFQVQRRDAALGRGEDCIAQYLPAQFSVLYGAEVERRGP
jgi:hypothetical protein